MSDVHIRILGPLTALRNDEDVTPTSRRERHTLALLAIHREMTAAHLVDSLWPVTPRSAKSGLQVAISHLRTLLGHEAIETTSSTYRLAEGVDVDLDEFKELMHSHRPEDWQRLIAMTARRVLDDLHDDDDIRALAHSVYRHRRLACVRLSQSLLATNDPMRALDLIEREAFDDPNDPVIQDVIARAKAMLRLER